MEPIQYFTWASLILASSFAKGCLWDSWQSYLFLTAIPYQSHCDAVKTDHPIGKPFDYLKKPKLKIKLLPSFIFYMYRFATLIRFFDLPQWERFVSVYSQCASVYLSCETFLLLHNTLICHRKWSPSPSCKTATKYFTLFRIFLGIANLSLAYFCVKFQKHAGQTSNIYWVI